MNFKVGDKIKFKRNFKLNEGFRSITDVLQEQHAGEIYKISSLNLRRKNDIRIKIKEFPGYQFKTERFEKAELIKLPENLFTI